MKGPYILYYDSGTSNTRAYLLDTDYNVCHVIKRALGSKDSAIAGNNSVLISGFCDIYEDMLRDAGLRDSDIVGIYASGMVTSPYGLHEISHLPVPLSVSSFADNLYCYHEETRMHRDIWLVPGLKTQQEDFSFIGNMRGEEIELIGALDELKLRGINNAALILPGSHTHIARIRNDVVEDIVSNFTGELFFALKKDTILAPILEENFSSLDREMVSLGVNNLLRFGFNRAVYIAHAMRIMDRFSPEQRFSYIEGVINGGVGQALDYFSRNVWQDCRTAVLIADEFMFRLFEMIISSSCSSIKEIVWLRIDKDSSYGVKGLKKINDYRGIL